METAIANDFGFAPFIVADILTNEYSGGNLHPNICIYIK